METDGQWRRETRERERERERKEREEKSVYKYIPLNSVRFITDVIATSLQLDYISFFQLSKSRVTYQLSFKDSLMSDVLFEILLFTLINSMQTLRNFIDKYFWLKLSFSRVYTSINMPL